MFINKIYHGLDEFNLSEFANQVTFTYTSMTFMTGTITAHVTKSSDEKQSLTKSGAGMVIVGNSSTNAPAKESTSGGSTLVIGAPSEPSVKGALPEPSEYIILPAHSAISDPKIRKQLGLSPQQEKKLREISAAFMAEERKFGQEVMKITPKDREAKSEELKKKHNELRTFFRKQLEEAITPQQLDDYKKLAFPMMASGLIHYPEAAKIIGITPEQKQMLQQLRKDMSESMEQESQNRIDRSLALLSREQLEKLRVEEEQQYRETHEPAIEETGAYASYTTSTNNDTLTLNADSNDYAVWVPFDSETGTDNMVLPVYENLNQAAVRKILGLSADQEKQLREIASDSQARKKKHDRELQNLTPEEQRRKLREFQQETLRMTKEIRQKIEALLTPEQLAKLKDNLFHTCEFGCLAVPQVQDKIGLSDRQKADLNRIGQESREKSERFQQELFAKELGLFTPGQQEKLREEFDRRGW